MRAHQYVGKYQSCMVDNGRFIRHAFCTGSQYSSQLVILHYRAPELLLGAHAYGAGIDVWCALRCVCLFSGRALAASSNTTVCFHIIRNLETMHD